MKKSTVIYIFCIGLLCLSNSVFCFLYFKKTNEINFKALKNQVFKMEIETNTTKNFATCFSYIERNYLITNYHPFENINSSFFIYVYDINGSKAGASILNYNKKEDICLLKVDSPLVEGSISRSQACISDGENCYAIGNANDDGITIYKGIVSNAKYFLNYNGIQNEFIKSQTNIYPGCSGGCLFNSKGQLAGMLTFRLKDQYGSAIEEFGYSIPIKRINSFFDESVKLLA